MRSEWACYVLSTMNYIVHSLYFARIVTSFSLATLFYNSYSLENSAIIKGCGIALTLLLFYKTIKTFFVVFGTLYILVFRYDLKIHLFCVATYIIL